MNTHTYESAARFIRKLMDSVFGIASIDSALAWSARKAHMSVDHQMTLLSAV